MERKKLTKDMYKRYMDNINGYISNIEDAYKDLDSFRIISKFSFEEWENWINKNKKEYDKK